ncbi:hypothetical protein GCK72_012852 [Caenorhabditis remanei]|uniref:Uncharacterized protein n=1 Tax=Caenorhabditis remanei TaxID=31234 RepID=A0A6A5GPK5_CAERE|nr:hypothetical protein GCK72_012852 [Caenorhabditis remanei]KAF1756399.1 hypothetical protein GCK72_012852 [Caenorhabditis remanei]
MWSDITACALVNGTGILVYSLCDSCASTITIRNRKYRSKFCNLCEKRTFALKYPAHAQKYPITLYVLPCVLTGRGASVTVALAPCCRPSITISNEVLEYDFCVDCQKRTTLAKFPKPIPRILANHQSTSTEQNEL